MRVCVLSDEVLDDFNPGPFLDGYEWEMFKMRAPVMETIKAIAEQGRFDVYLNLCEGYDVYRNQYEYYYEYEYEYEDYYVYYYVDENEAEQQDEQTDESAVEAEQDVGTAYESVDVIRVLSSLNLPYTGADEGFFDPTREKMQAVADTNGIGFAKGYRVQSVEEAERLVQNLRYPIMVKHPKSYGSTGMLEESKAGTLAEVKSQVERICGRFGAARMEEFIEGREFNVLVVDNPDDFNKPFVYPPTELVFPVGEEFWHKNLKWADVADTKLKRITDDALSTRLKDMCQRFYLAMHGVGYGRCDVRMNGEGELFILEINPNSGIMYLPEDYGTADHMIMYDKDGYKGFFDRIFRSAIIRREMRAKTG